MKNKLLNALDIIKNVTKNCFLFKNVWKEKTTLLLHGSREVDKTPVALEIAAAVEEQGKKAIYIDTQSRLDSHIDLLARAPELLVLRPSYDSPDDNRDYADIVIAAIEEAVAETDVRIFIIDSITRIAALSFGRNSSAAYVMKRLVALQVRCGLSLVVVSHDSTKASDRALLALADNDISLSQSEPTENSEDSVAIDSSEVSSDPDKSEISEPTAITVPGKPRSQLSRRDRRLLRRQKQQQANTSD